MLPRNDTQVVSYDAQGRLLVEGVKGADKEGGYMTDIIIVSLLVLILCAEVVCDLLLLKVVSPKARAEPEEKSGVLNALVNAVNTKKKPDSWHERWEKGK